MGNARLLTSIGSVPLLSFAFVLAGHWLGLERSRADVRGIGVANGNRRAKGSDESPEKCA